MADSVAPVLRPVYDELSAIVSALKNLSGQDSCDEEMVRRLLVLRKAQLQALSSPEL